MESKLLQFNGVSWSVFRMGESAWLIKPQIDEALLDCIHKTNSLLERSEIPQLVDVIPAYDSLTLIFNSSSFNIFQISDIKSQLYNPETSLYEIPVCYNLGLDWDEMEQKTMLKKEEIISVHSSKEYTIAMTGFLPGFVFLEGLDEQISVSRKENPRIKVPSGSIGIGGNQTGIYSIESPGGWQIIGRTPELFFDVNQNPPIKFKAGDKVRFQQITNNEFLKLTSNER
tara:strand:- start:17866 stop:18549 length:684 start_codon:yes stop_codon:yes gene_type:complete